MRTLSLLFCLLFLNTACVSPKKVKFKTLISVGLTDEVPDNDLLNATQKAIQDNLAKVGFETIEIKVQPDNKTMMVSAILPHTKSNLKIFRGIVNSSTFSMWHMFRFSDFEIQNNLHAFPQIEGLTYNFPASNGQFKYPNTVLAYTEKSSDLKNIQTKIQDSIPSRANVRLMWSHESASQYLEEPGNKINYLYMINTKGQTSPPIDEQHIDQVNTKPDAYTGVNNVNISLNEKGSKIWQDMTTEASNNDNHEIAIVVNDKVYSSPRVMSPIMNGYTAISGNFSEEEAEQLAAAIGGQHLPLPTSILSEEVIELPEDQ